MIRVLLEYVGDSIELPFGETIVGRDLSCQIRLNDPSVSRRHVRFVVRRDNVTVEDLGSRNGTRLNGAKLLGASPLRDGDQVLLGTRGMRVRVLTGGIEGASEATLTGQSDVAQHATDEAVASPASSVAAMPPQEIAPPEVRTHNCPQCRTPVAITADRCPNCGHVWAYVRPHAVTKLHLAPAANPVTTASADAAERRSAPRLPVEIAVLYTSESLAFEATARDLSRTGMFIATELLEPVGTACRITVLLDGAPAVAFGAVVTRVVEQPVSTLPAGLGARFTQMSAESERWLLHLLDRIAPATGAAS